MEILKQAKYFTIFEYEKEQEYLREMHNMGWKLLMITGLGMYHFEKCEPEDVVYQLDYNPDGMQRKTEYIQMFKDCGWEYLTNFFGYSYFRKPASEMNGEETIFCDENSRMEMMDRVMKGRFGILGILFFTVLIPQFVLSLTVYHSTVFAVYFAACIVFLSVIFLGYLIKRNRYMSRRR